MFWMNRSERRKSSDEAREQQDLREVTELIAEIGDQERELGRVAEALGALASR
jgi:phage host-nuclease inhibitor protein Gam